MNYMLKHLSQPPEKGLPGDEQAGFTTIQYSRSFEHLEAFATHPDPHHDVWRNFMKRVGKASELVPVAEAVGARRRLKRAAAK